MAAALVLELDVLLDLEPIAVARARADWTAAKRGLGEVRAREPVAGLGPAELVQWASELGSAVGVLSDLPGPLARSLLERFELRPAAALDASAGRAAAPRPDSLAALIGALGAPAARSVAIGGKPAQLIAATQAGALSAVGGWAAGAAHDRWPDLFLASPADVLEALASAAAMRPLGEVLADGVEPLAHAGSLLPLPGGGRGCGRYYSASDRRLAGHRLGELVIAAKQSRRAAEALGRVLAGGAALAELGAVDLVVSVPGNRGIDRFAAAREAVAGALGARAADLVAMVRAVDGYTALSRERRRAANDGRFAVRGELAGERVLLIDDVYTSGAQSRACARALLGAGAGEVTVLVAAVSQEPVQRECPSCGEGVMRRIAGDYAVFYGCTNFHCKHTERWDG